VVPYAESHPTPAESTTPAEPATPPESTTPPPAPTPAPAPVQQPLQAQQQLESKPKTTPAAQPESSPTLVRRNKPLKKGELIEMNFKNIEVSNFLQIMSDMLDIPMLWDDTQVKGNLTLLSPKKFNRDDALRIFETVLAMNDFSTIRGENSPIIQVVPTKDAPRLPSSTLTQARQTKEANFFITQIIPLRFGDANQIKAALTPLISKSAAIAIYPPANILVISDVESNVERLAGLIKELDIPAEDMEFRLVKLKYAQANKMAPLLSSLSSSIGGAPQGQPSIPGRPRGVGQASSQLKIVAEERVNALILVGDIYVLTKLMEIITSLDVPGTVQERGVKVIRLNHADADEIVTILKNINLKNPITPNRPIPGQPPQPPPGQPGGPANLPDLTITSDKATNSLIVFGEPEMIHSLELMLVELDVRRPQVFVEVLIMEMTLEKSLQLGVRWQATRPVENGVAGIGIPDAAPRTLEATLANATGATMGIVGNTIAFQGQQFASFSGFVQATQQDQDLNVLANPQILTLNNQEAEINVSQVVPVSTRTVTNSQLQSTTEYEFKDIGIILKITPQITGEDRVRLIIKQESSSIAARQDVYSTSQQAVTTLKRSINTQVVVDNNMTMAIGGLIQDQAVVSQNKMPCLGDIPLLGWLFKTGVDTTRKTNLIVFIRPRIVFSAEDMLENTRRTRQQYEKSIGTKSKTEDLLKESFDIKEEVSPKGDETP